MNIFVFCLFVISTVLFSEEKKTIFLISTPRSLSVGFLRMMQARNDFAIFHEPCNAPYVAIYHKAYYENNFRDDCFESYEAITESILDQAKTENVFIKDVSFCCREMITEENPLLQSAHFAFLVRKPQDVILSLYRKGLKSNAIREIGGYQQFYELFELVDKHAKYPPYLIFSEDLGENPSRTVKLFCDFMNIPFMAESLKWNDLGSEFNGREWRDGKTVESVQFWHGDAIHSDHFMPLRTCEVDEKGIPTFSEIADLNDRAVCLEVYFDYLPYYLSLKEKWKS